ncbi:MAG: PPC domain-containing protein [Halothece sp.]
MVYRWNISLGILLLLITSSLFPVKAQSSLYNPISLPMNQEINDELSAEDIPTGEGGFARDYYVDLESGDQISIDLKSDDFDTLVRLIASDGTTVAENDDGPDGTTNSLLFTRMSESGRYIIRVRAFGETGGGDFTLKITRLQAIEEN